jgi:ABC-2 type transport system ATP-binding protein
MIRVEHLTKRFGLFTAVDDLSFEVGRGEVLGFLGPNGAGKTTTMRILTGFIPATMGTVSVAGHDVFEEPLQAKRRIGYLPEGVPVYTEMVVADYLHFVSELKGVPSSERTRIIEQVIEQTDIGRFRGRIIGHLSKGMKKRVGIAQALLGNPDVLVLDEPTEGLDPSQVVSIRELVTSLGGERTLIVSTHILSEVEQTCTRVLIVDDGRKLASDSVDRVRKSIRGDTVQLRLEVMGSASEAQAVLSELPGVTSIEIDRSEGDTSVLSIDTVTAETAPEVAAALINAGIALLEMRRELATLEQVFLTLTRSEQANSGASTQGVAE